jgi:hypothetical protein
MYRELSSGLIIGREQIAEVAELFGAGVRAS